jgi:CubicO group peptidase (beta-lactamase class C family)
MANINRQTYRTKFMNRFFQRFAGSAFLLVAILSCKPAPQQETLPGATPESQGISSTAILRFLEAVEASPHELHSFMLLRHGAVVAEGWWAPYGPELVHTLYSTSKSFTATAIGLAASEGLLSLDDRVVDFFPESCPDSISLNLAALKVRHLLSMTAGQEPDPTFRVNSEQSDWVKGFLATPVVHEPGSVFLYNSLATYMLSAIVQKLSGMKLVDYLQPRLFGPLGIEGHDWESCPMGINTGGWGLRIRTEDMARFGQLFLQKGQWEGRQVLPVAWVEEASSIKIEQAPNAPQEQKDASDWLQGYCYQMWRCRNNAYRADGAFGQFIIVLPEVDAVVVMTAETPDMQGQINLVWEHLLPAFSIERLPADPEAEAALAEKLAGLALPLPDGSAESAVAAGLNGKRYTLETNDLGLSEIRFDFADDRLEVVLKAASGTHILYFGAGDWYRSETTRRGPYLVSRAPNHLSGLPPFKVAGAFRWTDEQSLALTLRYIESPHTEHFVCRFEGDEVEIGRRSSFEGPESWTVVTGTAVAEVTAP